MTQAHEISAGNENPNRVVLIDPDDKMLKDIASIADSHGYEHFARPVSGSTDPSELASYVISNHPSLVFLAVNWDSKKHDRKGLLALEKIVENSSAFIFATSFNDIASSPAITGIEGHVPIPNLKRFGEILQDYYMPPNEARVMYRTISELKKIVDDYIRVHTINGVYTQNRFFLDQQREFAQYLRKK